MAGVDAGEVCCGWIGDQSKDKCTDVGNVGTKTQRLSHSPSLVVSAYADDIDVSQQSGCGILQ